jgi:hypothetical protein
MRLDLYKANPADHFNNPFAVLLHPELSAEDKKDVLLSWKDELVQLQTATEENMPPLDDQTSEKNSLRHVQLALEELEKAESGD